MPLLSIIVPTFNSAPTVEKCLRSVERQSFKDLEVIIQDGLSTDGTLEAIEKIRQSQAQLAVQVDSSKDLGIYDAMNKGMCRASGEWVYFLGSDDELGEEDVLTTMMAAGKGNHQAMYGNVRLVGDTAWAKDGSIYDGAFTLEKILNRNICHQAIFYRRELIRQIGEYNPAYVVCADWDFNLRCWARAEFKYVDMVVANFHAGGNSSANRPDPRFATDLVPNIMRYFDLSLDDPRINTPNFAGFAEVQKMQQSKSSLRRTWGWACRSLKQGWLPGR